MEQIKDYCYKTKNPEEKAAIIAVCKAFGVDIDAVYERDNNNTFPYAVIMESGTLSSTDIFEKNSGDVLCTSFVKFIEVINKFYNNGAITVILNNSYKAVFKPKDTVVEVGCQKIPVDNILLLADKIRGLK